MVELDSRETIELRSLTQVAEFLPCELKHFFITGGDDELTFSEFGFEQADDQIEEGVGIQVVEMSNGVVQEHRRKGGPSLGNAGG